MNQLKMVHVVLEEGQMVSYHKKIVRFQKIIFKPFTSSHISSEMSRRGRSVMMGVANRAALWLSCGCTPLVEQGLVGVGGVLALTLRSRRKLCFKAEKFSGP